MPASPLPQLLLVVSVSEVSQLKFSYHPALRTHQHTNSYSSTFEWFSGVSKISPNQGIEFLLCSGQCNGHHSGLLMSDVSHLVITTILPQLLQRSATPHHNFYYKTSSQQQPLQLAIYATTRPYSTTTPLPQLLPTSATSTTTPNFCKS